MNRQSRFDSGYRKLGAGAQGWSRGDHKESWGPKNGCFWTVVLEKTLESPLDYKEIQPVYPKGDQSRVFIERTDVEAETPILQSWCTELTHLKRPWCGERLRAGGEGDNRGWDGWMTSPTQWTWVWVDSRSWWWTGRPGVLQFMGSQRIGHDWATELNWTELVVKVESEAIKSNIAQEPRMLGLWVKVKWKWIGWVTLIQMTILSTTVGKNPLEEME